MISRNCQKTLHISRCLQLAILLEVSANKPGNVNFTSNFKDTHIEHFLASAIAAGPVFQKAASRGIQIAEGKRTIDKSGLGELIELCIKDVMDWQRGGNTILGTIMLLIPISIAAGMTPINEENRIDFKILRKNINNIIYASTATDSVHLYEAIDLAKPNGLNQAPDLNVNDPTSKQRLITENVTLHQVFNIAKNYDDICKEWIDNYPITFDEAYPYLREHLTREDRNSVIVNVFLKILAQHPDTFIARKAGIEKAQNISIEAKKILEIGGATTTAGKKAIAEFDHNLRKTGNNHNPGTTADLIATALALCTLDGYRP
ncbi:MAG: triphosphoribosyl-dephospho-CoA synthase [Nitrososphaerota archaeon]|jgi:triphosphoribosyl-dephospho-CoA synthase|nr:triphosphoribosyl-dephospho-CoA synthase [Nitrososphaerota archaeon]